MPQFGPNEAFLWGHLTYLHGVSVSRHPIQWVIVRPGRGAECGRLLDAADVQSCVDFFSQPGAAPYDYGVYRRGTDKAEDEVSRPTASEKHGLSLTLRSQEEIVFTLFISCDDDVLGVVPSTAVSFTPDTAVEVLRDVCASTRTDRGFLIPCETIAQDVLLALAGYRARAESVFFVDHGFLDSRRQVDFMLKTAEELLGRVRAGEGFQHQEVDLPGVTAAEFVENSEPELNEEERLLLEDVWMGGRGGAGTGTGAGEDWELFPPHPAAAASSVRAEDVEAERRRRLGADEGRLFESLNRIGRHERGTWEGAWGGEGRGEVVFVQVGGGGGGADDAIFPFAYTFGWTGVVAEPEPGAILAYYRTDARRFGSSVPFTVAFEDAIVCGGGSVEVGAGGETGCVAFGALMEKHGVTDFKVLMLGRGTAVEGVDFTRYKPEVVGFGHTESEEGRRKSLDVMEQAGYVCRLATSSSTACARVRIGQEGLEELGLVDALKRMTWEGIVQFTGARTGAGGQRVAEALREGAGVSVEIQVNGRPEQVVVELSEHPMIPCLLFCQRLALPPAACEQVAEGVRERWSERVVQVLSQ